MSGKRVYRALSLSGTEYISDILRVNTSDSEVTQACQQSVYVDLSSGRT
jgi:hypothetical protein